MANSDDEFHGEILLKLDRALFWLKVASYDAAREYVVSTLDTEQKLEAYRLTDGQNTIEEIMQATGIKSKSTVSNWWSQWMARGIVRESTLQAGRKQQLFDLSEFGL